MKQKEINVAFIGAGNIAYQHMLALKQIPDANIKGLYDIDGEVLQKRSEEFGGEVHSSIDNLLDNVKPDVVFICLPPYAHGEAEFACIERRIPFLVEKPQSNDMDLARTISDKVQEAGIITCAAYMNRYRKGVNEAKRLLQTYPVSSLSGGWLFETPLNHPWITRKKLSGGQLLEQTTHLFDLIRYLCGEITEVQGYGCKGIVPQSESYDIEDASIVSLKLESGAVASIQSSWSAGFDRFIYLNAFGPDIQIQFENWELDVQMKARHSPDVIRIPGESNIFEIEISNFLSAVKEGNFNGIKSDYADGVKSLRISFAALKSIETGDSVLLDDLG